MAEYDLLILNGLVVTVDEIGEFDIAVKDGKIAKVVPKGGLAGASSKKTIDAQGGMVQPGGVDAHVYSGRAQFPRSIANGDDLDIYKNRHSLVKVKVLIAMRLVSRTFRQEVYAYHGRHEIGDLWRNHNPNHIRSSKKE